MSFKSVRAQLETSPYTLDSLKAHTERLYRQIYIALLTITYKKMPYYKTVAMISGIKKLIKKNTNYNLKRGVKKKFYEYTYLYEITIKI